jgi:hypothetical protein
MDNVPLSWDWCPDSIGNFANLENVVEELGTIAEFLIKNLSFPYVYIPYKFLSIRKHYS